MKNRGFTLVELLVTTAIFIVITLVVLANYPKANGQIALRLLANNVALSIREAQVYGVSIKGTQGTFPDYGVSFKYMPPSSQNPSTYYLFADITQSGEGRPNGSFNEESATCGPAGSSGSGANECMQEYKVNGQNQILKLCGITARDTIPLSKASCWDSATNDISLNKLTILFRRPNPDALMRGEFHSIPLRGGTGPATLAVSGILLGPIGESDPTRMKMIEVWNTGQITIQ